MKTKIALLALLSSCSVAFPLEGFSRRADGGGASSDAGDPASDGGSASDAGRALPRTAVLVGGSWTDAWLARFDAAGAIVSIESAGSLNGPWSALVQAGDDVVAINDFGIARGRVDAGELGPWDIGASVARPNVKGDLVATTDGVLNTPGERGDEFMVAAFRGAGLDPWRRASTPQLVWVEPLLVAGDTFVLLLGGQSNVNGTDVLTASIEVASLGPGPTLGPFSQTTPLPQPLRQPAITLADGALYVCGGLGTTLSAACWSALVSSTGTVGTFEALAALPMPAERGVLLKVGPTLSLLGASTTGDAVYSLDLATPAARWSRSSVRQPEAKEVGRALLITP